MSGYLDGMGVATLAGQCWHRLAASVPGFRPLDLSRLAYCGLRDLDPGQLEKVQRHGIRSIRGSPGQAVDVAGELDSALGILPERVLVHLDLDCPDTAVGQANDDAAAGGLSAESLVASMRQLAARRRLAGLTIASFDPALPGGEAIAAAGIDAAEAVIRALG